MPLAISTNIAAEKANYYLGYNADKVQESIKRLASGRRLTSPVQDPWEPGRIDEVIRISEPVSRSDEQCSKRDLFFGSTGRYA